MIEFPSANWTWGKNLVSVLECGNMAEPRGMAIREIIAAKSVVLIDDPVITLPQRELNYKFMVEEALWILEGRNDVFHKNVAPYSDNGRVMQGAYGPKITEQILFVVEKLQGDPDTRQAVINTWRESPRASKDVPCTLSFQFIRRKGVIHMVVTMRSSDLWLGFPYDVFSFAMIGHYVRLFLEERNMRREIPRSMVAMGGLFLTAGSLHLYEKDVKLAAECSRWESMAGSKFAMNLYDLSHPEDLINRLKSMRDDKEYREKCLGLT